MELTGKEAISRYRSSIYDMMVNAFSGVGMKPHVVDDAYNATDDWFVLNESGTYTVFNGGTSTTKGPAVEHMMFHLVQIHMRAKHRIHITRTRSIDELLSNIYSNAAVHPVVMAHRNAKVAKARPQMTKEQKFKYAQERMREILGTDGRASKRQQLYDQLKAVRDEMEQLSANRGDSPSSAISHRMNTLSIQADEINASLAALRSVDIRATEVA